MQKTHLFALTGIVVLSGFAAMSRVKPSAPPAKPIPVLETKTPEGSAAHLDRKKIDGSYMAKPRKARAEYERFVEENRHSDNREVQDEVASARIRLGYLAGKEKDFVAAREVFQTAAKEYKGTGKLGSDFGGLEDQAAYKRVVKLQDGEADKPLEDLLQAAVRKQDEFVRFETSVCGPKAIVQLLTLLGKPAKDYKEVAKLCGTDSKGTTVEGMKKGLRTLGLESFAMEVNSVDFANLPLPAIWLVQDHYVLIVNKKPEGFLVYDPRSRSERRMPPPPTDDNAFLATVLTLELPRFLKDQAQ